MKKTLAKTEAPAAPNPLAKHNMMHARVVECAQEAALWAAALGIKLQREKAAQGHGHWLPWVAANCTFSRRTASEYLATAERAIGNFQKAHGLTFDPMKEEADDALLDCVEERIFELIEDRARTEEREQLLAALRPAKATAPTLPPMPAKARKAAPAGPRPLFRPTHIPRVLDRWKATPPDAQHLFLDAIREEALAYFQAA